MKALSTRFNLLFAICLFIVAIHLLNMFTGYQLNRYGILPRNGDYWYHIFFAPWIHGSITHVVGNLLSLVLFSLLCLVRPIKIYLISSLFIIVASGILIWLFGRSAYHIGASGWIYGLWALSIAMAWFDRKFINIIIGFVVAVGYSGMLYGLLPNQPGVSVEAHLFGALTGVIFAYLYSVTIKWTNSEA